MFRVSWFHELSWQVRSSSQHGMTCSEDQIQRAQAHEGCLDPKVAISLSLSRGLEYDSRHAGHERYSPKMKKAGTLRLRLRTPHLVEITFPNVLQQDKRMTTLGVYHRSRRFPVLHILENTLHVSRQHKLECKTHVIIQHPTPSKERMRSVFTSAPEPYLQPSVFIIKPFEVVMLGTLNPSTNTVEPRNLAWVRVCPFFPSVVMYCGVIKAMGDFGYLGTQSPKPL